jgi:hypothetical protein
MSNQNRDRKFLGVELPFGFCLMRGRDLRELQKRCREAEFMYQVRGRMIDKMLKQLYEKGSKSGVR